MPDYVPDPDISQLVRELNRSARRDARREAGPPGSDPNLDRLLEWAAAHGASDLLLTAGSEAAVRIDGEIVLVDGPILSPDDLGVMFRALLDPDGLRRLAERRVLDLGFERAGAGRFRANLHYERGAPALSIRLLPEEIPALDDLHLPAAVAGLAALRRGLVLVTGPAGTGKSTTLAALLARISQTRSCHILTIEDPIEYRLPHARGLVEQVEIGRDATSFAAALRSALRQAPDVVMVGEMRDPETIAIALTAAETGLLVLSSLHTGDTAQAIDRILDVFPSGKQEQVRTQLAVALQAITAQVLLSAPGRTGRRPACELLLANDAVRTRIRKGETHQIHQEITLGKSAGMVSLEESLASLVRQRLAEKDEASRWVRRPEEFEHFLRAR